MNFSCDGVAANGRSSLSQIRRLAKYTTSIMCEFVLLTFSANLETVRLRSSDDDFRQKTFYDFPLAYFTVYADHVLVH